MRAEQLKGHLDALLLAVLEAEALHGYAIIEALRERSGATLDLPEGSVYPEVHRLEEGGLLATGWGEVGGRRRRVYGLTKLGRSVLETKKQEWGTFVAAVQAVLRGAPWPTTT